MPDRIFGEPSEIMTPASDAQVLRLSEIQAMRSITDALSRLGKTVDRQGDHLQKVDETLSDMRVLMAEMRQDRQVMQEMRTDLQDVKSRVRTIEDIHTEQRGWAKIGEILSKAIPWLLGIVGVSWGLLSGKH